MPSDQQNAQPLWVVALLDTTLSAVEYRVWSYIHWRQGGNGHAYPSQPMIARDMGLTEEGVRKITKRLEVAGWLTVTWSGPGRGKEHHKQYAVKHPQETPTAVPVLPDEDPNSGLGLTAENPNGRTMKTPTAVPSHIRRTLTGTLPKKNIFSSDSDPMRLSRLLFDLIRGHDPGAKEPDLQRWAVHVDRLIRLDGRSPADIEAVIRWCQADHFWHSVILSPEKLRAKFGGLVLKSKEGTNGKRMQKPTVNRDYAGQTSNYGSVIEV